MTLLVCGIVFFFVSGYPEGAVDAMTNGGGEAVSLCLSLCGGFMLWMGLMEVARECGLVDKLSRLMTPIIRRLIPSSPSAVTPVTLNLAANFLGLGGAATPFGLDAMREFKKYSVSDAASDDMCMFIALNSSAVELLPTGVLALRVAAGSLDAYCVVVPTFIASVISAACAILLCKLLSKRKP